MRRRWFVGALMVLLLMSISGLAFAHTMLKRSVPEADGILEKAPERIELQFNEEVEAEFGAIAVYDHTGNRVDKGDAALDPRDVTKVVASLTALRDGLYTVAYRVVSADGHPVSGSYGFTVGKGIEGARYYKPVMPDPNGPPPTGLLVGYWLAVGGLLVLMGLGITQGIVARSEPSRRYGLFLWLAVAGAAIGSILFLIERTGQAAGVSPLAALNPSLWGRMLLTKAGRVILYRLVLLLWTAVSMRLVIRRWWAAALAGTVGLATVALGGHAAALEQPILTVSLDWLHLLSAATWTGGLVQFAFLVPMARRGDSSPSAELGIMVRRFSALAAISVAVLIGTGLYPALLHIPSQKALWQTTYGMALVTKLSLIIPLLLLGAANLLVVGPRLRRNESASPWLRRLVYGEVALMAAVLAVAALLTNVPPARFAVPPEVLDLGLHSGNYEITYYMSPLAPGYRNLEVAVRPHEGALPGDTKLTLELVAKTHDMGKNVTDGKNLGDGRYRFENVLIGMPGPWNFILEIAPPGAKADRITWEITVPEVP